MGFRPFSWGKFGVIPDPPEYEYIDEWEQYALEDEENEDECCSTDFEDGSHDD